jgi:hypothetical protein
MCGRIMIEKHNLMSASNGARAERESFIPKLNG